MRYLTTIFLFLIASSLVNANTDSGEMNIFGVRPGLSMDMAVAVLRQQGLQFSRRDDVILVFGEDGGRLDPTSMLAWAWIKIDTSNRVEAIAGSCVFLQKSILCRPHSVDVVVRLLGVPSSRDELGTVALPDGSNRTRERLNYPDIGLYIESVGGYCVSFSLQESR